MRGNGRRWHGQSRLWIGVAPLLALIALAVSACAPLVPPFNPSALASTLSDAAANADPKKEGSDLWQRTTGPNAWMYKVALPQNRLLMYYVLNNYGAGAITPIGTNSDSEFVAKMKTLSGQYAAADAAHPVVSSIDLVNPVADGFPGPDKMWRHFRPDSDVQHFLKIANDNKMLFFFDMEVGKSTALGDIQTQFMTYLLLPNVNIAIDPEYEYKEIVKGQPVVMQNIFAPSGSTKTGLTPAVEINQIIDLMSSIVTIRHLPPKILLVHLYYPYEAPDWSAIQPKPGVTVVLNIDGQGPPGAKIDKYNFLVQGKTDNRDLNGYLKDPARNFGFKVYLQIQDAAACSCYAEFPIMSPQQVLALKPPPIVVQYG
jgi:hypothetical protein